MSAIHSTISPLILVLTKSNCDAEKGAEEIPGTDRQGLIVESVPGFRRKSRAMAVKQEPSIIRIILQVLELGVLLIGSGSISDLAIFQLPSLEYDPVFIKGNQ